MRVKWSFECVTLGRKAPRPVAGGLVVLDSICDVLCGDRPDEWVVGVGLGQQGRDRLQQSGYREGWAPGVALCEHVEAYLAVRIDVAVVDARSEVYLWRPEWVVCWKLNRQEEDACGIHTRPIRASDDGSEQENNNENNKQRQEGI
jgi:hypothetical protein